MGKDNQELEANNQECGGAGGDSLAGYEYQIDVSVWLALDLVLAAKLTHELVLALPSQQRQVNLRLSASIMYSQVELSYMKEGLASIGPVRTP
jgi:hypothetical protein